jgi:hypothetical protein
MAWSTPTSRSTGDLITAAIWNQDVVNNPIALTPAGVSAILDGGGALISTGDKMAWEIPYKCTLDSVRLQGAVRSTGNVTSIMSLDVSLRHTATMKAGWYFDGTSAIEDSTGITLSSTSFVERSDVSGFALTQLQAGDWMQAYVNSISTTELATLALRLTKN